jgi:hypothetical protein
MCFVREERILAEVLIFVVTWQEVVLCFVSQDSDIFTDPSSLNDVEEQYN